MNDFPKKDASAFGLSDLLPPALIKDMRQLLRSPLYLCLLALCFLILLLPSAENGFTVLLIKCSVILCAFVPLRSSSALHQDIRERGSNFLQLCPLSAWRIVMGQFLSATVQILLLGLCLVPVLWHLHGTETFNICFDQDGAIGFETYLIKPDMVWVSLVGFMLIAMLQTAVLMALACLHVVLRFIILVGSIIALWCQFIFLALAKMPINLETLTTELLLIAGGFWLVLILCFLLLARRYYCASVEMNSGLLRLLVLIAAAGTTALNYSNELKAVTFNTIYGLEITSSCFGLLYILILDELLPRDTGTAVPQRFKGIFGFWRKPSSTPNFVFMLLLVVMFAASRYAFFWHHDGTAAQIGESISAEQALLLAFYVPFAMFTALYVPLAMTNIISKTDNRARIIIYCICKIVVIIASLSAFLALSKLAPEIIPYISWPVSTADEVLSASTPFAWYIASSALFCLGSFGIMRLIQAHRH